MVRLTLMIALAASAAGALPVLAAEPASDLPADPPAVAIDGAVSVHEALIRRELAAPVLGAQPAVLRADLDRLMRTNLFRKAEAVLAPEPGPATGLTYRVEELPAWAITGFAIGYSTRSGLSGGLSLANWNAFGAGHQLGVGLHAGQGLPLTGELAYMNPWMDGHRLALGGTAYRNMALNEPGNFAEGRLGGRLFASRPVGGPPLGTAFTASASLQVEEVSAFETGAGAPVAAYADGRPVTLSANAWDRNLGGHLGVAYDTRSPLRGDERFNRPTEGMLGTLMLEPTLVNGTSPLLKATGGLTKFFPLPGWSPWSTEPSTFVLSTRFGAVAGSAVPAYKKLLSADYYADAVTMSVTGYERLRSPFLIRGHAYLPSAAGAASLMPRVHFSGSRALVNTAEYRFPIAGPVSGVAFLDYGGFWEDQFALGLLHAGYGGGCRIDTPLGLMRLDMGFSGFLPPQAHFGFCHQF